MGIRLAPTVSTQHLLAFPPRLRGQALEGLPLSVLVDPSQVEERSVCVRVTTFEGVYGLATFAAVALFLLRHRRVHQCV